MGTSLPWCYGQSNLSSSVASSVPLNGGWKNKYDSVVVLTLLCSVFLKRIVSSLSLVGVDSKTLMLDWSGFSNNENIKLLEGYLLMVILEIMQTDSHQHGHHMTLRARTMLPCRCSCPHCLGPQSRLWTGLSGGSWWETFIYIYRYIYIIICDV